MRQPVADGPGTAPANSPGPRRQDFRFFSRVEVLGVPVVRCRTKEFIDVLVGEAAHRTPDNPAFVTYLNAWCSNIAARDEAYAQILHCADAVYADGQAIVWASAYLRRPLPERVNAADFILDFMRAAAAARLKIFLLGSSAAVADDAAKAFREAVPGLEIAGVHHGYFTDDDEAVREVTASSVDLLILGMGVPRQEKWAWANRNRLNVRAIWCVGAMFEYHSRHRGRAPVWMRRAGLEWLFRLVLEPRRMWRRYLIGNVQFVTRVMRARRAA